MKKSLLIMLAQCAAVAALFGWYSLEGSISSRGWAPVHQNSIERHGRYVRFQIMPPAEGVSRDPRRCRLEVRNDRLVCIGDPKGSEYVYGDSAVLGRHFEFYADSSAAPAGELWAQVIVGRDKRARIAKLGILRDGQIEPLQ